MTYDAYAVIIAGLHERVVDLTADTDLLAFSEFRRLHDSPLAYFEYAKQGLGDKCVPDLQKSIMVFSMQRLPINHYIAFLQHAIRLRAERRLSAAVFTVVVMPGYHWNTRLAEYFEDHSLRAVLIEARTMEPRLSEYIDRLLCGQGRKDIAELREGMQIPETEEGRKVHCY